MARRHLHVSLICLLAVACLGALAGCGKSSNKPGETVREGLSTPLDGLSYTVFLTRQLNLKNVEDSGYLPLHPEAPPGKGLYGVFIEACNKGDKPATVANNYYIEDTQGHKFEPERLPKSNPYAFQGGATVPPENCEPARGSLAQQGPTSGSLLLFNLPLGATENRPLELHIQGGFESGNTPAEATVILDI